MNHIQQRLEELGIELPVASLPAAHYVPYRLAGTTLYIAGQLPLVDNQPCYVGEVPSRIGLEDARRAARLCGINLVAQMAAALEGELDRVEAIIRLGGFVRSDASFTDHATVLNGASDLMTEIFGPRGAHVRVAVGASSLPRGAPVEVEATVAVRV